MRSVPFAIVVAGVIIGAAILAGAWIESPRYAVSQLSSGAIARMDVHSGQIDICQPDVSTISQVNGMRIFGLICANELGLQTADGRRH